MVVICKYLFTQHVPLLKIVKSNTNPVAQALRPHSLVPPQLKTHSLVPPLSACVGVLGVCVDTHTPVCTFPVCFQTDARPVLERQVCEYAFLFIIAADFCFIWSILYISVHTPTFIHS